jgi:hypothetical protein
MGDQTFQTLSVLRKFTVVTSYKPLTWIISIENPGSRLIRWKIKLKEYDYEIVFRKGRLNTNADVLSCICSLRNEAGSTEKKQGQVADQKTKTTILYE